MKIQKFNKSIHLKLDEYDEKTVEGILQSDDIFMSDLCFETFNSEWLYLQDTSTDLVYDCCSSGLNESYGDRLEGRAFFKRLLSGKTVILPLVGTVAEYTEN